MLSRLAWNLVTIASIATLGGVVWYFVEQYNAVEDRRETVVLLRHIAEEEGPCAALMEATSIEVGDAYILQKNIDSLREAFVAEILPDGDARSRRALSSASREGLISGTVCEQIRLLAGMGEVHPVLALLRFTREKEPCEEALALDQVIDGLGSNRALLLRGLMEHVAKLSCLSPEMNQEVAIHVADMAHDDPQSFDDLDVLRIAKFLETWAPLQSAQVGCRIEAMGGISRLGNAIGCTQDHTKRILTRYRYPHPISAGRGGEALPADSEVYLVRENRDRCEVRPVKGTPRVVTVACEDLSLTSGVELAVLADRIKYGAARADMISGLADYHGPSQSLRASRIEPSFKSWFAFSREGQPLGATRVVDLKDLAVHAGVDIPNRPLRQWCKDAGARFCYDVDWTQLVSRVSGEPVVFLSRPLGVFLAHSVLPDRTEAQLFTSAFGREPREDTTVRVYPLNDEALLIAEIEREGFELRWRKDSESPWVSTAVGVGEPGNAPPSARILAAMDLQRDGMPELIVQRVRRALRGGQVRSVADDILLLYIDAQKGAFDTLTRLTIHEY